MIVYLSIGNSDDKLTQREWSEFCARIIAEVTTYADIIHGLWFSDPGAPWQNACWCLEFKHSSTYKMARETASQIRKQFRQDSIAWADAINEFI